MTFAPNDYGIYDIAGNVREWVLDWFDPSYYENSPTDNPQGPVSGEFRASRGGSWSDGDWFIQFHKRHWDNPVETGINQGFRCAKDATP